MKISRIFRKYSRVLLLVFMSLLLVIFLVGDVIGRAATNRQMQDVEIGQAWGEPVFLSNAQAAEADFEMTAQLRLRPPPVYSEDPHERNLAMYLLMEEARRADIVVGTEQIVAALKSAPGSSVVIDAIRARSGRSLDSIYQAAARVSAPMMLAQYQASALMSTSMPEVEQAYRDANQAARVKISVLDAKAFLPNIPEPTEAELQAQFEQYKNQEIAHTDEERIYGYKIADRVRVEYLTIDPTVLQEEIHVSRREAERYYNENKQKYMKEVDAAPFALDEQKKPEKIQMTYEEVESQVREDCRSAKAIVEAQRLVNMIQQEARRPWDAVPLDENGERGIPPAEAIKPFEELAAKYITDYPDLAEQLAHKTTDWITQRDLRRERDFSSATATIGRQPMTANQLAFQVEGLVEPTEKAEMRPLRVNEPGPVVLETRQVDKTAEAIPYQAYVFRVVGVKPSGPPESIEEVRPRLTDDLKQQKAFEIAREQAGLLAEQARQNGLTEAVAGADALKALMGKKEEQEGPVVEEDTKPDVAKRYLDMLEPFEPEKFSRQAGFIKNVGYSPTLQEKVFADPSHGGPDLTQAHPILVVPMARALKFVVIEPLEILPLYQGDFELKREELEKRASWKQIQTFMTEWFDTENIKARAGYIPVVAAED